LYQSKTEETSSVLLLISKIRKYLRFWLKYYPLGSPRVGSFSDEMIFDYLFILFRNSVHCQERSNLWEDNDSTHITFWQLYMKILVYDLI
jgi:hypothetical protein